MQNINHTDGNSLWRKQKHIRITDMLILMWISSFSCIYKSRLRKEERYGVNIFWILMRCMCVTDQQHGLFTEQLLLQHLQVSLLLLQLTSDILLSITTKQLVKLWIRRRDAMSSSHPVSMSDFWACDCKTDPKMITLNTQRSTKLFFPTASLSFTHC